MQGCVACRGTYLGSAWSEFRQVKEVWEEVFGGKPYSTHTLAISGAPHHAQPCRQALRQLCPAQSIGVACRKLLLQALKLEAVISHCEAGRMACTEEPSRPASCT